MTSGGRMLGQLRSGEDRRGAEAFAVSPFNRLARTHAAAIAGDMLVTVALADSLFFSIDPNDARWRVGLYLLLTIAPFAVVAPWLGPLMDRLRGGHRAMILVTAAGRALLCVLMARNVDGLALFPLAFSMLVLGKTYSIARSALVPSIVVDQEALVGANSRLALLSAIAGAVAAIPGALLLRFAGSPWVLSLAATVFLAAAVFAVRIPRVRVASEEADAEEKAELRGAGILLAASGMGYLRGVVGFLTMLLAFSLRGGVDPGPTGAGVEVGHRVRESLGLDRLELATGGSPPWHFGVVLIGVGIGGLLGSVLAPRLRAVVREEAMLTGVLGVTAALAVLAAIAGGLVGSFVAALSVSTAAAAGKQAFDAIVQRDAPEANLGRSFSRFETRFQLLWVVGALVPVVVTMPARLGYILMAITAASAAFTVTFGRSPLTRVQAHLGRPVGSVGRRLGSTAARGRAGRAGRRSSRGSGDPTPTEDRGEPGPVPTPPHGTDRTGHAQAFPGTDAPTGADPTTEYGATTQMDLPPR